MTLIHGDCIEAMAGMEPESVDAIVTDPPYNLTAEFKWGTMGQGPSPQQTPHRGGGGFMGKQWDGEGIAFRRETWEAAYRVAKPSAYLLAFGGTRTVHRMTCALEDAGWIIRDMLVWGYASGFPKSKASLKPAWEPIVMARKPGPLRMLAIDECRIGTETMRHEGADGTSFPRYGKPPGIYPNELLGRWPANIVLTDPIFDGGIQGVVGGGEASRAGDPTDVRGIGGIWHEGNGVPAGPQYGDTGTYSRFFMLPKSSRSDREPVITPDGHDRTKRFSTHPTVKPVDLMRHLVRLVTPTGGTVLDPFLGSGTSALAAEMEGFAWIGIEREAEYVAIAEARLNGTQRGLGLETA